jgi:hypothetical protein
MVEDVLPQGQESRSVSATIDLCRRWMSIKSNEICKIARNANPYITKRRSISLTLTHTDTDTHTHTDVQLQFNLKQLRYVWGVCSFIAIRIFQSPSHPDNRVTGRKRDAPQEMQYCVWHCLTSRLHCRNDNCFRQWQTRYLKRKARLNFMVSNRVDPNKPNNSETVSVSIIRE